jgi:hypothetical protein
MPETTGPDVLRQTGVGLVFRGKRWDWIVATSAPGMTTKDAF